MIYSTRMVYGYLRYLCVSTSLRLLWVLGVTRMLGMSWIVWSWSRAWELWLSWTTRWSWVLQCTLMDCYPFSVIILIIWYWCLVKHRSQRLYKWTPGLFLVFLPWWRVTTQCFPSLWVCYEYWRTWSLWTGPSLNMRHIWFWLDRMATTGFMSLKWSVYVLLWTFWMITTWRQSCYVCSIQSSALTTEAFLSNPRSLLFWKMVTIRPLVFIFLTSELRSKTSIMITIAWVMPIWNQTVWNIMFGRLWELRHGSSVMTQIST